jgi:hypothetical protein
VLAPILGVCTGLIFLLCLYWYESLQARFLYTEVWDLKRATHIRVTGKSKNFILKNFILEGNIEIVKLQNQQIFIQGIASLQQSKYTVEKPMLVREFANEINKFNCSYHQYCNFYFQKFFQYINNIFL